MAFELFESKTMGRTRATEPTLTISKRGTLTANGATVRKYFADTKYIVLIFDPDTKRGESPYKPETNTQSTTHMHKILTKINFVTKSFCHNPAPKQLSRHHSPSGSPCASHSESGAYCNHHSPSGRSEHTQR